MHISEGISGTINSARTAIQLLNASESDIVILDSYVTAMVLKMQILEAAKAANGGASFEECVAVVKDARERCGVLFTVKTLDFLERGGRLTRMQALAGNLLQLRPILTFEEGKIVSIEKVRTYKGALKSVKQRFFNAMEGKTLRNICATYTDNEEFVNQFMDEILAESGIERPADAFVDPLTPVVGTHTGPGCVGLGFMWE